MRTGNQASLTISDWETGLEKGINRAKSQSTSTRAAQNLEVFLLPHWPPNPPCGETWYPLPFNRAVNLRVETALH